MKFSYPSSWNIKELIDCTSDNLISYGIVQPGTNFDGGIPMLRVNNIGSNGFKLDKVLNVQPDIEKKHVRTRLKGGEVLITVVGTTGMCMVVPKFMEGWNVARAIAVIRPTTELGAEWIKLCLQTNQTKNFLDARANTTVQKTLNLKDIKKIPIPLPPQKSRENIQLIIGSLDDKIELNRKMNQTLEEMAQALFKSCFIDFTPVHAKANTSSNADYEQIAKELGISRKVLDLFPDKFEESGLGMIPIGWKVKELGDFFPVVTGKKNANIATNDGKYIFFTCSQSASKTDVYSFDAAAILLAGNCDFNVKWYRGKFEAYQRTYVLIPRDIEFLSFLYFLISYKLSDITQSSQGSVVKFITKGMIENYKIALPNEIVLKDLVGIFSNINFKIEGNLEQIKTLQKTRDTLLPKLLSGELDVSELELDNATH